MELDPLIRAPSRGRETSALRRSRVIAHDEEPAARPPPAEAQQLPTNSVPISATSTFWRTVSSYGLNVSGPEQLRRLHALFDTLGEAAAVAENLQPKKTAPLATWPTAAEIAALAEEVRRLDDLVVGSAGSAVAATSLWPCARRVAAATSRGSGGGRAHCSVTHRRHRQHRPSSAGSRGARHRHGQGARDDQQAACGSGSGSSFDASAPRLTRAL